MSEEIYPLDSSEFPSDYAVQRLAMKLNEVIHEINKLIAPPPQYGARQLDAINRVESGEVTIDEIAAQYKVAFYDNVSHAFDSPVYCIRCEYHTQSLLDRLVLAPDALCDGCIHKAKFG